MEIQKNTTNEIDILAYVSKVLKEWKLLLCYIIIFTIIGIVYAINTPKKYTCEVVLAPEASSLTGMSESLGDIASFMGVDLGGRSQMDAIYPQIYPDVLSSTDFILTMFDVKVTTSTDNNSKRLYDHIINDVKIPFWSYPSIWLKQTFASDAKSQDNTKIDPFELTTQQMNVVNTIRNNIYCNIDKKTNIITLGVTDFDKRTAAILADTLQRRLQQYLTDYRTKKERNDLQYMEKQLEEAKSRYEYYLNQSTSFTDSHLDVVLASYKAKETELNNKAQSYFTSYTQLQRQVEAAKSQLQQHTPSFTIIQNATVPEKASSTPRSMLVMLFVIVGVMIDSIWVLFLRDIIRKKKNNNITDSLQ